MKIKVCPASWRRILAAVGIALLGVSTPPAASAAAKLNFVFILVDDMGWTDLACMGSEYYETPNIDRLAAEGMKFSQAYAACTVCSPTRAAVLTGKYPARLHITDWIEGHKRPKARLNVPDWTMHLPLEETTLAEALKPAGYVSASIGKWHLGGEPHWPDKQGFDENVGGYHRGQPPSYFAPYKIPTLKEGPDGEYLTDRETAEAERFIETNRDRPFYLYLPHYCVHTPLQAKPELVEKYRSKPTRQFTHDNPTYAAMIESLDQSTGRILAKLDQLGLADRTVVFFTSDNGGLIGNARRPITSNQPLRAGKGSAYEGGVRVPLLVKWPGVTEPGSLSAQPVISVDFYPTILEMAGLKDGTTPHWDGMSLVPLLRQQRGFAREAIYWHYPHYHPGGARPYSAIRAGDFRLVEFFEDERVELYDLAGDIGETIDLANQLPEKVADLRNRLDQWRKSVDAQLPTPNPNYDPATDPPLPPSNLIRQSPNGTLELQAKDAAVHGTKVRYEPQPHKNTIGYWTKDKDWVSWEFELTQPGKFQVTILQGCGPGSGGSEVSLLVAGQKLSFTVQETRGFQDFIPRMIGTVELDRPGRFTVAVKPERKPGLAVMDLRRITFEPVP